MVNHRLNIPLEDFLHCESYYEMCDYAFLDKDEQELPSGVINCDTQALPAFIRRVQNLPHRKYIVVCSRSDYGLAYQKDFPVWKDIISWTALMTVPELGYRDIEVKARVKRDNCNINDEYSIRCYSMTSHTFKEIPSNIIQIYSTNCHIINDVRLIGIPFGLNVCDGDKSGIEQIYNFKITKPRDKLLYLNASLNTFDRVQLYAFYKNYDYCTVKSDVSPLQFLEDLSTHKFVLCPAGNGTDQYRIWEALYMGAIPVVEINECTNHLIKLDLPILSVHKFITFKPNELEAAYGVFAQNYNKFNWSALRASYWHQQIEQSRRLL